VTTLQKTVVLYSRAAWKHKGWLLLHLCMVTIAVICDSIIVPLIASRGINLLPAFLIHGGNFWHVFSKYINYFIIFTAISWTSWRLSGLAIVKFEIPVMRDLSRNVFNHLMEMSNRFFTNTFGGSLVAQTNRYINSFEKLYDSFSFDLLVMIIRLVFSTAIIFTFAPTVAVGLVIWSILFIASALWLSFRKLPLSKTAATCQSQTTARLADSITNIVNIKYFAREKYEINQFNEVTQKQNHAATWDWGIQEVIFGWQSLLIAIFEVAAFWLSLHLVASHQINFGQLVLIQAYIASVFSSLWNVSRLVRRFESSFADAAEMSDILYTEPEIYDSIDPLKCAIKHGNIDFENVSFDHKDATNSDPLFNKLNLSIKYGERVGLAGPSGGGKTTLTKLLLRMSDIDSGNIKIDGQDISKIKQGDLRASISYVPQEPILFHRSLLDNIRYGKSDAAIEEAKEAAKKAHADEFINKLPEGYETLVGERGVKLSGGQRQRIAIARAMLKDAPILVLDEATSALDSESEMLIQDALWNLMQGRTAIVIAHRLSTIQKLDRILVLDNGNIVEDGSHQELIAKKGLYAKLWAHQSGGFF